jgi:hypothetical protein
VAATDCCRSATCGDAVGSAQSLAAPSIPQFILRVLGGLGSSAESGLWGIDDSGRAVGSCRYV